MALNVIRRLGFVIVAAGVALSSTACASHHYHHYVPAPSYMPPITYHPTPPTYDAPTYRNPIYSPPVQHIYVHHINAPTCRRGLFRRRTAC